MTSLEQPRLAQLPDEMFTIIKAASGTGARLGRLALPRRKPIATPHFLATTSRGVVPHLTQDNFASATDISGVYVGLEDCKLDAWPCHMPYVRSDAYSW